MKENKEIVIFKHLNQKDDICCKNELLCTMHVVNIMAKFHSFQASQRLQSWSCFFAKNPDVKPAFKEIGRLSDDSGKS